MNLIDENGRIFGTINIIDAVVVFLVLAVVAAGLAFVLGYDNQLATSGPSTETTTTITVQVTDVQSYVSDAIPEGPIETETIVAVENKSVRPTEVVVEDENGQLHERTHPQNKTVTLRVTLNTRETDEDILFEDEPLEVGRQLALDFGPVTVKGTITSLEADS